MANRRDVPQPRRVAGRRAAGAIAPVAPSRLDLPGNYAEALAEIKRRVVEERHRVVLSANSAMVLLYWDIGRLIVARQEAAGWGARVIDRLSADLRAEFPDSRGFSARNLKYMRAFSVAWPDRTVVQQGAARIPWFHNCVLLDRLAEPEVRLWYIRQTIEEGWSRNILELQIDGLAHERRGKALGNFSALPSVEEIEKELRDVE